MAFSDKVNSFIDAVIFLYLIGWVILAIGFVVAAMYITKIQLDKSEYDDASKAGIYIGVFILSCLLSFILARYLPIMIMYIMANN
jgi:hypothetical protein